MSVAVGENDVQTTIKKVVRRVRKLAQRRFKDSWFSNMDHVIGAVATVVFALILYLIMCNAAGHVHSPSLAQQWLDIAVLTFGVVCGWVAGTLISPTETKEAGNFAKLTAAVGTLITGYFLSKAEGLVKALQDPGFWSITNSFRLLMWTTGLLLATMATYVLRAYLLPPPQRTPALHCQAF